MTEITRRNLLLGSLGAAGALAPAVQSARTTPSSSPLGAAQVNPRSSWASGLDSTGPIPTEDVRFLIVHHTLEPGSDYTAAEVPKLLRGIFAFHTGHEKSWPDIAYNFFVDRFGGIWEGRSGSLDGPVAGSATGGNQGFTQLCCFLGDHTVEPPTPEARESMSRLLAGLADRYSVDTSPGATVSFISRGSNRWKVGATVTASTIAAHMDMSQTECPGAACEPLVRGAIPERVRSLRATAAPAIASTTVPTPSSTQTSSSTTTVPLTSSTVPSDPTSTPSSSELPTPVAAAAPTETESPDSGDGVSPVALLGVGVAGAALVAVGLGRSRRTESAAGQDQRADGDDGGHEHDHQDEGEADPRPR